MFVASTDVEFDLRPYRPKLNPDFVRRVRQRRRLAAVEQAKVDRRIAFEKACAEAFEAAETARAVKRAEIEAVRFEEEQEAKRISAFPRTKYQIVEARACRVFGVHREQLHSIRRDNTIVAARHFVMYWALRLTALSMPQIGKLMGGRDHTTVMHGRRAYIQKRAKMGRHLRAVR